MAASKRRRRSKKKLETSKLLAHWAAVMATASAITSYALAANELDPVSDLTSSIFKACIGYLITYAGKSLGEKVSRNMYGLDADGNPLQTGETTQNNEEAKG